MIPKIIHYCWFGRGEMPELAIKCIESWHKHMPGYQYKLWNEDNFDINTNQYVKEAYEARKFAFVTDYVRLYALFNEGGIYMDTDVEVFRPLDNLLNNSAFAGFEGSKYSPVGTCIIASEPNGTWISEYLMSYSSRHFKKKDGSYDLTTNVVALNDILKANGVKLNGLEQEYKDLHIFPVDYFSPRHTTGEYIKTQNTYCDHYGVCSWAYSKTNWKSVIRKIIGRNNMTYLIKIKRKLIG